jgi:hypothetical protein
MSYLDEYYKNRCTELQKEIEIFEYYLNEGIFDFLKGPAEFAANVLDSTTQGKFRGTLAAGAEKLGLGTERFGKGVEKLGKNITSRGKEIRGTGKDLLAASEEFQFDKNARDAHTQVLHSHFFYDILPKLDEIRSFVDSTAMHRVPMISQEEVEAKIPKKKLKAVKNVNEYDALYHQIYVPMRDKLIKEEKKRSPSLILGELAQLISDSSHQDIKFREEQQETSTKYFKKIDPMLRVEGIEQHHGGHWAQRILPQTLNSAHHPFVRQYSNWFFNDREILKLLHPMSFLQTHQPTM